MCYEYINNNVMTISTTMLWLYQLCYEYINNVMNISTTMLWIYQQCYDYINNNVMTISTTMLWIYQQQCYEYINNNVMNISTTMLWIYQQQCYEYINNNVMNIQQMLWIYQQCYEYINNYVMNISTMLWIYQQCYDYINNNVNISTMLWIYQQCYDYINNNVMTISTMLWIYQQQCYKYIYYITLWIYQQCYEYANKLTSLLGSRSYHRQAAWLCDWLCQRCWSPCRGPSPYQTSHLWGRGPPRPSWPQTLVGCLSRPSPGAGRRVATGWWAEVGPRQGRRSWLCRPQTPSWKRGGHRSGGALSPTSVNVRKEEEMSERCTTGI